MATWQEPKLDWAPDDFFNAADANRIEENTEYLADLMASKFPPAPDLVPPVTDRDKTAIDYAADINRMEGNIGAIRQAFFSPPDTEPPKTDWQAGQPFGWRDARRMEQNIASLHYYLTVSDRYTQYCGTFYAGQAANAL